MRKRPDSTFSVCTKQKTFSSRKHDEDKNQEIGHHAKKRYVKLGVFLHGRERVLCLVVFLFRLWGGGGGDVHDNHFCTEPRGLVVKFCLWA